MTRTPVRISLLRKITWFGGDRRLVGFAALVLFIIGWSMFMGFGFFYGIPIIVPALFFSAILWVARQFETADSWMVDIGLRQLKYRKYYAPKPDMGVPHPSIRDFN